MEGAINLENNPALDQEKLNDAENINIDASALKEEIIGDKEIEDLESDDAALSFEEEEGNKLEDDDEEEEEETVEQKTFAIIYESNLVKFLGSMVAGLGLFLMGASTSGLFTRFTGYFIFLFGVVIVMG